jgi:hypothetical protein
MKLKQVTIFFNLKRLFFLSRHNDYAKSFLTTAQLMFLGPTYIKPYTLAGLEQIFCST